ncbi:hypothetical protein E2C01_070851 [Portunus trituberculatus]|uniref:Uncharacterized protein n=1 Tax=Portunus trituberculatus TaxID=210409 RepID=A0A5B7HVB3_PORTR|nr:hypothetical protein [Portunus trituberculatus]
MTSSTVLSSQQYIQCWKAVCQHHEMLGSECVPQHATPLLDGPVFHPLTKRKPLLLLDHSKNRIGLHCIAQVLEVVVDVAQ